MIHETSAKYVTPSTHAKPILRRSTFFNQNDIYNLWIHKVFMRQNVICICIIKLNKINLPINNERHGLNSWIKMSNHQQKLTTLPPQNNSWYNKRATCENAGEAGLFQELSKDTHWANTRLDEGVKHDLCRSTDFQYHCSSTWYLLPKCNEPSDCIMQRQDKLSEIIRQTIIQ